MEKAAQQHQEVEGAATPSRAPSPESTSLPRKKPPRHPEASPGGTFAYLADATAVNRFPYQTAGVPEIFPAKEILQRVALTGRRGVSDVFFLAILAKKL